ncbi:MAG: hypothetical protein ABR535_08035, partial [Pyrinomonadaceae bacterium]
MKLFEGRSPTEKKKIVAALVLGTVSLISLIYAFGPNFSSSGKTITVKTSPTPRASVTPAGNQGTFDMPSREEQNFYGSTVPVAYAPPFGGPEP